jgi:FKBP-type peptidyl-prolyl cis-trans isomerase FkpA
MADYNKLVFLRFNFQTIEMIFWSKRIVGLVLLVAVFIGACKKEEEIDQKLLDHQQIEKYVADNNLNGYFTASGLYYLEVEEGTGGHPDTNSRITVAYKGYGLTGYVRDESDYFTSKLEKLIPGWQEGIPLMKEEGKCTLIIPSHLAYTDKIWLFDITLFEFSK